jgi:TolA-binding protein
MKLRINPFRTALLAAGLTWAVGNAQPAAAQMESREAISLQDQIAELRQELQIMQQNQQAAGQPMPQAMPQPGPETQPPTQVTPGTSDTVADLVVRVSALEDENRTLRGRIDDLTNQLQHVNDTLAKQISDLAFKLGQGAQGGAPPDAGAAPAGGGGLPQAAPPPEQAPPPPKPHMTPEQALRAARLANDHGDYESAAAAAHQALAAGHGAHVAEAELQLGRAEGGQHMFREAATDYFSAYKHAPKAPDAPIALLGMANAFIAQGKAKDACQVLALIPAQFPQATPLVKAGTSSARHRASCSK